MVPHTVLRLSLALLCAAPCALGQYYVDVTASSGLTQMGYSNATFGSGIASGDFDGDGDQDLIAAGNAGEPLSYFRNIGGMQFQNGTAISGLGTAAGQIHGLTCADIDNDGDLDLYVCNWRTPATLFINNGSGVFTEEAQSRGLVHSTSNYSANFGDYDRDGWLDLYVGNRGSQTSTGNPGEGNLLYRNLGGGIFQDVTATAGVGDQGMTFASAFMDYNEDGWPDIVVVNDKGQFGWPNNLYENNRDGTFTSVAAQLGANIGIDGMGVDYTDVFCDGGVDFFATDSPTDHLFMRWDEVQGKYVDASIQLNMLTAFDGWSCHFYDYDNDGWQDLYVVNNLGFNSLFRNPGQPASLNVPWLDIANLASADHLFAHYSTVLSDFDDDGRIDFCHRHQAASQSFQAPFGLGLWHGGGEIGNWIKFRTIGTQSNRDGIGARVDVHTGTHVQRQWVRSGVGFMSSPDLRLHFGIGTASQADKVVVTWPSGQVQQLDNVPGNQVLDLVEPEMSLGGPVSVGGTTTLAMSIASDAGLPYAMVMSFTDVPRTVLPDGRSLPLTLDPLSGYTIVPGNALIPSSLGLLNLSGNAVTPLMIPNVPAISGMVLYATGASFEPQGFPLVRTIFPQAVTIQIL